MFLFSSRRRHTRWPRDWSSDVCSSDLAGLSDNSLSMGCELSDKPAARKSANICSRASFTSSESVVSNTSWRDRKSVVEGKSVDPGGGAIIADKQGMRSLLIWEDTTASA